MLGEGAGVVVVESAEHALARGATPIAEILGGALTADAFHISAPDPTGPRPGPRDDQRHAQRGRGAGRDRLDRRPRDVDVAQRLDRDARDQGWPTGPPRRRAAISSPKSMIGHLVGAAGIASALAALGGIRDGVISPTANLHTPDPECDLDYVPLVARKAKVDTVAINGFGFGGQNAVTIFRRFEA